MASEDKPTSPEASDTEGNEAAVWGAMFAAQAGLCVFGVGVLLHLPIVVVGGLVVAGVLLAPPLGRLLLASETHRSIKVGVGILAALIGGIGALIAFVVAGVALLFLVASGLFLNGNWLGNGPQPLILLLIAALLIVASCCCIAVANYTRRATKTPHRAGREDLEQEARP